MEQGPRRSLGTKYASLLLPILIFLSLKGYTQTYNPSAHVVVNDAVSPAQATPIDSRSMFYDPTNFLYRPYQSTGEVLSYLNLAKYRAGNFIIVIDSGGFLQFNGTYLGGSNTFYMFKDSTGSANLVKMNLFNNNTGCPACLQAANNLSDLANVPTARSNLGLGSMATLNSTASGDLGGTWPNINVNRFNGQLPAYYLNYANFTNTPPLVSLTTTGTSGVATYNSGTGVLNIPNYTGAGGGSCLNCNADTIGNIPLSFPSFPNGAVLTLDSVAGTASWKVVTATPVIPPNIGAGFRVYSPQVPGFRSFICSGCTIDSTTNTNALTITVTSGGVGTVTSFSAGALSPLFTTSVATATSTPALTFSLSTAAANSVFGNNTGSTAAPAYFVPNATTLNGWFGGTIQGAISLTTTGTTGASTFIGSTLNIPAYQGQITLTTTGTSGAATLIGNTLNIPNYAGGVTGVSNSDGTLTISPTSGAVVASLALGHANTWSALQTFGTLTTTGVTKFTGIASGASTDSILTINPSNGQITWRTGQPYPIYAVQGISPIGNSADSFALGGSASAFFRADTILTAGFAFSITGLPSKSTALSTDSVLIETTLGQIYKLPVPSGGGGGDVITSPNSTLTIGGTSTNTTLDFNLANANSWTAAQSFVNINFSGLLEPTAATGTQSIGDATHVLTKVYTRNTLSDGNANLGAASGSEAILSINGVAKETILSTGQENLAVYTGTSSFPVTAVGMLVFDASGNIGTQAIPAGGGSTLTFGAGLLAGSYNGSTGVTINADTLNTLTTQLAFRDSANFLPYMYDMSVFPNGDTMVAFGHSYVFGANASVPAKRYSSIVCNSVGAIELNLGISGSTVMKQTPVDYQGALAFTERLTTIPTYTFNHKFLWFDGGLNDAGQTAAAYTTVNYCLAWDTVISYAINTKGWPKSRIGIMGVEFIGQTALTYYGSITGNAAPTYARMRQFDSCNRAEALKWGVRWIPMYDKIQTNDTTLLGGTGSVHPTDSGYAYIANSFLQRTGLALASNIWTQSAGVVSLGTLGNSVVLNSTTAAGVTTPNSLKFGGLFESSAHSPANDKLQIYNDGTANNTVGWGVASGKSILDMFTGGSLIINAGNAAIATFSLPNQPLLQFGVRSTGVSTATPTAINEGNTFSSVPGNIRQLKYYIYDNGQTNGEAGFTYSSDGFDIHSSGGLGHNFWIDSVRYLNVQPSYTTINNNMLKRHGLSTDSIFGYRNSSGAQDTVVGYSFSDLAGTTSVGAIGGPFTNAGSISGGVLTLGVADGTRGGIIAASGSQTLNPSFTFNNLAIFAAAETSINGSILSLGSAPSFTAGTGAGTSPTISISGTPMAGTITITPGTAPSGTGATIVTITGFPASNNAPIVILTPANAITAALGSTSLVFVGSPSVSSWSINSGTVALAAGTYKWNYMVIGF